MKSSPAGLLLAAVLGAVLSTTVPTAGQTPGFSPPRAPDGKPNLNGIWQALNSAEWDLQAHAAQPGRPELGALGAVPPGLGVVEGNEIPYQSAAAAKRRQNLEQRATAESLDEQQRVRREDRDGHDAHGHTRTEDPGEDRCGDERQPHPGDPLRQSRDGETGDEDD